MKKTLPLLVLLALPALGRATSKTYHVVQFVGSLSLPQSTVSDPYLFLDFQLTNGSEAGADDSMVRIAKLALTAGGGAISYDDRRLADLGLVTGTGTDFTLHNVGGAAVSERDVLFRVTSGNAFLSYDFTLTSTGSDAPIPDGFAAGMLYRTGAGVNDVDYVGTLGPTGSEMVAYAFDGGGMAPAGYGVDPAFATPLFYSGDYRFTALGTPTITPVPEPSAFAALGLGAVAFLRRRRRP